MDLCASMVYFKSPLLNLLYLIKNACWYLVRLSKYLHFSAEEMTESNIGKMLLLVILRVGSSNAFVSFVKPSKYLLNSFCTLISRVEFLLDLHEIKVVMQIRAKSAFENFIKVIIFELMFLWLAANVQSLAKCRYSVLLSPGLVLSKDISLNLYSKARLYSSSRD